MKTKIKKQRLKEIISEEITIAMENGVLSKQIPSKPMIGLNEFDQLKMERVSQMFQEGASLEENIKSFYEAMRNHRLSLKEMSSLLKFLQPDAEGYIGE